MEKAIFNFCVFMLLPEFVESLWCINPFVKLPAGIIREVAGEYYKGSKLIEDLNKIKSVLSHPFFVFRKMPEKEGLCLSG